MSKRSKRIYDSNGFKRSLYGFNISARIKAWKERRRGFKTFIQLELVKADGTLLKILPQLTKKQMKNRSFFDVMSLAPYYAAWPNAKVAWVVYAKVVDIE